MALGRGRSPETPKRRGEEAPEHWVVLHEKAAARLNEAPAQSAGVFEDLLLSAVEAQCAEASLRLKAYLKCAYGLSDERCVAFNPDGGSMPPTTPAKLAAADSTVLYSPRPVEKDGNGVQAVNYKSLLSEESISRVLQAMDRVVTSPGRCVITLSISIYSLTSFFVLKRVRLLGSIEDGRDTSICGRGL